MSPSLLITTSHNLPAVRHERAAQIADRCGVPFVPRRGSLKDLFDERQVERVYVVSAEREVLHARDGTSIGVDEGMLKTRLHAGRQHPLIRAVAPSPVTRILDATLGLAADALHLAAALGVPVTGTEINPVVFSLLEGGLARMRRGPEPAAAAAHQITPHLCDARTHLEQLGTDSVDVVYLAPMFRDPKRAAPGYAVFRSIAHGDHLDQATLKAAREAARQRVVLKLGRDEAPPPCWPSDLDHTVKGKAVTYRVWESSNEKL